jgi:hypothetical protein
MKPPGDRHRRHVMTIIDKISSILDGRVASEAKWLKINQIAATAGNEFEYRRLIAISSTSPAAGPDTERGGNVPNWKYRNHQWFADQLP